MKFNIRRIEYKQLICIPFSQIAPALAHMNNDYLVGGFDAPTILNPDERVTLLAILGYKYNE